jgi:LacI family transcriptional regulator
MKSPIQEENALPATIRDVAKLAGCSIKTVSRVINGEPYVTEETRAKVQAAIRAVGYAPNISAKRLAENKSYMICILMYPGFYQPASEMLTRIMDIGYEENYDILIQPYFPPHARSKRKLVSLIYEHRIDGFVTTPPLDADDFVADMLDTYKVPQVQINPFEHNPDVPRVAGEDFKGAYAQTEYLVSLGHRRIAFLTGPRNMRASHDRLRGYQAALEANQLPYDETLVCNSEWTFDGGYTLARLLMERADRPSAIFAGNDEPAYGVIYAAQEMGLAVPGQLSVCGYDNLAFSNQIWPGLTTVHQPSDEMVELATRLLIGQLKGRATEKKDIIIPSRLIVRGSTDKPGE